MGYLEMIRFDHLVIVAPSLAEGVAHVRETLGVEMPFGGRHPNMGTWNHLLRLGDHVFLEVIAIDPEAPPPGRPRWFGLDDRDKVRADWARGHRLKAWVANTRMLAGILAQYGVTFGIATAQSRGALSWQFAVPDDGALIMDGALPYLIEWSDGINPAHAIPDLGCRLKGVTIEHPKSDMVRSALTSLSSLGPVSVRQGPAFKLSAEIETPDGVRRI